MTGVAGRSQQEAMLHAAEPLLYPAENEKEAIDDCERTSCGRFTETPLCRSGLIASSLARPDSEAQRWRLALWPLGIALKNLSSSKIVSPIK